MRYKNEFVAALLKEIDLFTPDSYRDGSRQLADSSRLPIAIGMGEIETIYFGGGTPSLCTKEELAAIIEKIRSCFIVSADAEITLEANPDDITAGSIQDWKAVGINRLSIGVQSFFPEDLEWMNRAHTVQQAVDSLQLAVREFSNITIDLIYGTPQLTNEKWKQNVEKAISLGIPHLSCYALTVEPRTPLDKMIRQHESPDIDPGKQSEQFLLLMKWAEEAGYEHYEISNFAKPGWRSRHNSSYWRGIPYYGFGPSAHSFDGNSRWWNVANNNKYIESINKNIIPLEKEVLTPVQKINEYIMTSLRTAEGISLQSAVGSWQSTDGGRESDIAQEIIRKSKKYIDNGLMTMDGDYLRLTKEGRLLADGIAADLFFE